jgi:acyl-CoA synthetase (AMP-forming)/AMP-acid ligase II
MQFALQLIKAGFLTPSSVWALLKAKRKHRHNICFLLKFAADRYKNKTAISDSITKFSFKELYTTVLHLSAAIHNKTNTVKANSAILICDNTLNHILALYAIQNLGLKLILINSKVHINDVHKIIDKQEGHCYLFTTDSQYLQLENAVNINELIADIAQENAVEKFSPHFAKLIFPTSGTTGDPKLIEKRNGEFYWLRSFADLLSKTAIHKRNAVYISIPVSQGFGYTAILFSLILGKKALITHSKDASHITDMIIQEKADLLVGVPTSLSKLAACCKTKPHDVHSVICGGAPLNNTILQNITEVFGTTIFSMYGSTETSVSFIAHYPQLAENAAALGIPLKGIQYKLKPQPTGGHELLIRSGLANISTTEGWLHTGDLACENNGQLIWCGRKDSMIIKSGINIYPVEIENELLKMPGIEDVYVAGQKHTEKGEIITAMVQMKPGFVFTEKEIMAFAKTVLSGIKVPDKIIETTHFEYTATGKKIKKDIETVLSK